MGTASGARNVAKVVVAVIEPNGAAPATTALIVQTGMVEASAPTVVPDAKTIAPTVVPDAKTIAPTVAATGLMTAPTIGEITKTVVGKTASIAAKSVAEIVTIDVRNGISAATRALGIATVAGTESSPRSAEPSDSARSSVVVETRFADGEPSRLSAGGVSKPSDAGVRNAGAVYGTVDRLGSATR
ncbi:MAG: hypothetical protein AAFU79_12600 [Myxococcota bacterium]